MAKATTLILDELIAIADEGYSDGLGLAYHEEPDGEHGDTLAKFVAVELADTFTEGLPRAEQIAAAIHAMTTAIRDLEEVVIVLKEAEC